MIKYLGSKRTLVPVLTALAAASQAQTCLDLFTGTTRVAQGFKSLGQHVTAVDLASYSHVLAKTFIELDANYCDQHELRAAIQHLNNLPGEFGYFTETFCEKARFFQPKNGQKIDAMRNAIETDFRDTWLYFPLLASLMLAADRVDSTTGVQMAFLKQWAARSFIDLSLRTPQLLAGEGIALHGDAVQLVQQLPQVDLAYLDPPYNQHRYYGNYHIWETLVRWDEPQTYGIANKRLDVRDSANKSAFNSRREMPVALAEVLSKLQAETVMLSYNNEAWLNRDELIALCEPFGRVEVLDFDFKRYVGSKIGIYNKKGERVGEPKHHTNIERIVLAGPAQTVKRMAEAIR